MHIAIDISPLESGHSGRGTGVYTRSLVKALQKYKPQNTYTLFTRVQEIPKSVDVVHFPYFDPFFLTLPLSKPWKTVVTVHDLIPLRYKNRFPAGIRGMIKWQLQKMSLVGAAAIVTDSKASKRDIHEIISFPKEKIHVVPLAPDETYMHPLSEKVLQDVAQRYALPKHFFLYVGDVNWNKNIPGLLTALSFLPNTQLVLVGKAFLNVSLPEVQEIHQRIEALHLSPRLHTLGYVDDETLAALYTRADASVVPSFAEGFGLPVLEAMVCGTPAVVARGSSLDEIAGPSIRVDPHAPSDIARGMKEAIALDRSSWQKKAGEWVKQYSWEKVANETHSVYESVAA